MKINYTHSEEIDKIKRKNLWALFFINLIHGMGVGMFNVVYQPFILELTNSIMITGVLITLGAFIQFIPMPLVGKLSDKIGRRKEIMFFVRILLMVQFILLIFFKNSAWQIMLILAAFSFHNVYYIFHNDLIT